MVIDLVTVVYPDMHVFFQNLHGDQTAIFWIVSLSV